MRLIYADNLEFMMFKRMVNLAGVYGDLGGACAGVAKLIKNEKTVDPFIHAHWKGWTTSSFHGCDDLGEPIYRDAKFYRCSKCNYGTVVKTNYCPNCGAKMKGGI